MYNLCFNRLSLFSWCWSCFLGSRDWSQRIHFKCSPQEPGADRHALYMVTDVVVLSFTLFARNFHPCNRPSFLTKYSARDRDTYLLMKPIISLEAERTPHIEASDRLCLSMDARQYRTFNINGKRRTLNGRGKRISSSINFHRRTGMQAVDWKSFMVILLYQNEGKKSGSLETAENWLLCR